MDIKEIRTGKAYHHATAYDRSRMKGHFLDWANQPLVYKTYPDLKTVPLPVVTPIRETPLRSLYTRNRQSSGQDVIDFQMLSRILAHSYVFTAKSRQPGHEFYYRSAASAGALYPCELYLAARGVGGCKNGIYHYGIETRSIVPLRFGNVTGFTGNDCSATGSVSIDFYITGIFFRSAWKYRERAFRYVLLDAGHLLENLILAIDSLGLPISVHYDFNDRDLECLLGIDGKREGILARITTDDAFHPPYDDIEKIPPLSTKLIDASRVSNGEVPYGAIESAYRAGTSRPDQTREARGVFERFSERVDHWRIIEPREPAPDEIDYPEVLFLRRSKRNFVDATLSRDRFSGLINIVCASATRNPPDGHHDAPAMATGFLCGNVEGITPGFYLLDVVNRKFGCIAPGDLTSKTAAACLDQAWLRHAALHFLFLTDLEEIDRAWGPRGYRYAMLSAGRIGQAIYLGATALGLGACGVGALYDDEARGILGLTKDAALIYLVAAGPIKH